MIKLLQAVSNSVFYVFTNISFYSEPVNEPNKLGCYIKIGLKGFPGANTLAYWVH
jgi:hypothetical protein